MTPGNEDDQDGCAFFGCLILLILLILFVLPLGVLAWKIALS